MTELKPKIPSQLWECLITTHKLDGSTEQAVHYDLSLLGGPLLKVAKSSDFLTKHAFMARIRERMPLMAEEEAEKLWEKRELRGL